MLIKERALAPYARGGRMGFELIDVKALCRQVGATDNVEYARPGSSLTPRPEVTSDGQLMCATTVQPSQMLGRVKPPGRTHTQRVLPRNRRPRVPTSPSTTSLAIRQLPPTLSPVKKTFSLALYI